MWLPLKLVLLAIVAVSGTVTRFTNIQCQVLDPTFCAYKKCELKVLGRGIVGINVHAYFLNETAKTVKINLSFWRKYNGFRPFMFNHTIDFCKFTSEPTPKLSFERIIYNTLAENSNMNHTCPYEQDIIVRNLVFKEEFFKYLPVPSGEYKIQIVAGANNEWKTNINIYLLRKEDLMQN